MPNFYEKPSEKLVTELGEVKDDAIALIDYLSNLNVPLPKEFPHTRLVQLANILVDLPDCTAKGCREPLLFAQEKLAALRSEHISRDEGQTPQLEDEIPRLLRREPVDLRITASMSSVSTALQAVNSEIAADPEISAEPDAGIQAPHDNSSRRVGDAVLKGRIGLSIHRDELDQLHTEGSENADRLRRRLTDALSLNWLASAELSMPRIVPAWLIRIGDALREYPKLIIAASTAVRTSTDIAEWAHEKWSEYNDKLFKIGTELIREVSIEVSRYGHELEKRRMRRQLPMPATDEFSENKARELILAGVPLPSSWEPRIHNLDLESTDFIDVIRLQGCKI